MSDKFRRDIPSATVSQIRERWRKKTHARGTIPASMCKQAPRENASRKSFEILS